MITLATNERKHAFYNKIGALFVLGASLAAYLATVAPTVPFWDCGEYIAACWSLGIPHPPGNPLYVILGRTFMMLFSFLPDVGFRLNLVSPILGALTAMLFYLITVKTTVMWMGIPDNLWKRITVYTSGIVGGLFAAFGNTFWFSCVESEVIVPAMLIVALGTWLALRWEESRSPHRDLYLLLIAYLVFLGIGIHMFTMMTMAPVGLFVLLNDREKLTDWRLWTVGILLLSVIYDVSSFFWLGPVVTLVTLLLSLMRGPYWRKWNFCFWLSFLAVAGYSVHFFIPIRSALQPIIDENHPVIEWKNKRLSWKPLKEFLERRQYGSENMITRMFWRRGRWATQFGIDSNMGYGGFHLTQFFHFGAAPEVDRTTSLFKTWGIVGGWLRLLIYLLPTAFMMFGWWYLYRRNRALAVFFITMVLVGTIGLVFYMNFADGTRPEKRDYEMWVKYGKQGPCPVVHREVRVRDYFFTPGFLFFGMWMGVAAGCLLNMLFTNKDKVVRTNVAPIVAVLLTVSPVLPLTKNFPFASRRGDWVPYDYAYNLLMTCEKDGLIFTNGDNDTFPLWALQEAYGVRKDVRIINLSLLNTEWYIKQLKKLEPKVPIRFSDEQIDRLNHEFNRFETPVEYTMTNAKITVTLPTRKELSALRIQDKMVLHIVDANAWRKPIYFAVTVSDDNKMGLEPYLQMQGLAYRLLPERVPAEKKIDIERTVFLLSRVYSYRGLGDGSATLNETSSKLLTNYAAGYVQVALALRQPLLNLKAEIDSLARSLPNNDSIRIREQIAEKSRAYDAQLNIALNAMDQCVALMPWEWRWRMLRQEMLIAHGRLDLAEQRARQALVVDPDNPEYLKMLGQALVQNGKSAQAAEIWRRLASTDENPWEASLMLARMYEEQKQYDSAIGVMKSFQESHPGDRRAALLIERFENLKKNIGDRAVLPPSDS